MEEQYQVCKRNGVDKKVMKYMIFVESIQIMLEVIAAFILFQIVVPKYIGIRFFIGVSCTVILLDILEMVVSVMRMKKNYYTYDMKSKMLEIHIKDFYIKELFIPIKHIKCITVCQNIIQRRYDLVDLIVSTGVSKYKIQGLSKVNGERFKSELGEIILKECHEKIK